MKYEDIKKLLNGEDVNVLDDKGVIQVDLDCNLFLALVYDEDGDLFAMNLHETIEEALEEVERFSL